MLLQGLGPWFGKVSYATWRDLGSESLRYSYRRTQPSASRGKNLKENHPDDLGKRSVERGDPGIGESLDDVPGKETPEEWTTVSLGQDHKQSSRRGPGAAPETLPTLEEVMSASRMPGCVPRLQKALSMKMLCEAGLLGSFSSPLRRLVSHPPLTESEQPRYPL